jgi:hypothetical protein
MPKHDRHAKAFGSFEQETAHGIGAEVRIRNRVGVEGVSWIWRSGTPARRDEEDRGEKVDSGTQSSP